MNFELSSEQQMLKDSVDRFVADNYDLEARNALVASKDGFSREHWQKFAELGWLALPFAEDDGGFGGTEVETMIVMEAFGRGLVVELYLASIVLGGGALRRAGNKGQRDAVLPGVMAGEKLLALAHAEEQSRYDLHDVTTSARRDGDHYVLNGTKTMVWGGQHADHLIVAARTSGGQIDTNGISLFLVDADTDGVKVSGFPTVDGLRAATVTLTDARVHRQHLLGDLDAGHAVLEAVIHDAILAVSAEAVGAMEVLYRDTVEYTQQREQFDHPLSDFQVLQHRMVEMFMETEQCRSSLYRAVLQTASGSPDAAYDTHALKHLIGKAGQFIGESAVQLHGGMGMTEELRIGHYFKRLLVIDSQFGNADYHLERFTASQAA